MKLTRQGVRDLSGLRTKKNTRRAPEMPTGYRYPIGECVHVHIRECHPGCGHWHCSDCGLEWDEGAFGSHWR